MIHTDSITPYQSSRRIGSNDSAVRHVRLLCSLRVSAIFLICSVMGLSAMNCDAFAPRTTNFYLSNLQSRTVGYRRPTTIIPPSSFSKLFPSGVLYFVPWKIRNSEIQDDGKPIESSLSESDSIEAESLMDDPVPDSTTEALTEESTAKWHVYVCQSKQCLERGAGATLDAFVGLAPSETVVVHPAILPRSKGKGPNVRCIPADTSSTQALEISNVDSVEKVYRILTAHMGVEGVDEAACECLKWNYRGNEHLEKGEISEAIAAYDKAIETGYADQEGVVLLMRATAYLKRASQHKVELQRVVRQLQRAVPDSRNLQLVYGLAQRNPEVSNALVGRVVQNSGRQESIFQHTQYRHGLYQYALLHAAHDALRATQRVPHYAKTWLRAGEVLAELWKLKESAQYYETAMELDPTLSDTLRPVIARLKKRQEFLNTARAYGCSEDTLRLSLDVAG